MTLQIVSTPTGRVRNLAVALLVVTSMVTPWSVGQAAAQPTVTHPNFSGNWWPGPEQDSPTNLIPLRSPRFVGWAPLSAGLPENRKPPTLEELNQFALANSSKYEDLALTDDATRLANRTGAPAPATTPEGTKRYHELSDGNYVKNYNEACLAGNVIVGVMGDSATIMQMPKKLVMLNDTGYGRTIYLDGRDDSKAIPSMFGYSIGKWEGKTLVVTTTNISGKFIGAGLRNGWPLSENAKLTEWFSLSPDGKTLAIKRVVEDPEYYTEPLGSMVYFDKTDDDLFASPCVEGLGDQPYKSAAKDLDEKLGK